jgi:hypothetical protein
MPVGLLSFGAPPDAFNGGLSQINSFFANLDTSFPFLNLVKQGSRWGYTGGAGGVATPDRVDANGYPTSFPASVTSATTNIFIPDNSSRSGNYVVAWEGDCTIGFLGQTMTTVSGSVTSSGGVGRYVFTPNASYTQINLSILASGFTSVSNLKLFHADDETALNQGEIFGTKFIEEMRELNCGVIRLGDWLDMNTGNITDWASRKSYDYFTWSAYELRSSLYAGTTTSTGDAFKIDFGSGGPTDKLQFILTFDHTTNTAGLTLELNSSGVAYPIFDRVGDAIPAVSGISPIAGNNACVVFDEVLGGWVLTTNNGGLVNGTPIEVQLALCRKLGAHPHIVIPYLSCEPMTDFVTEYVGYFKNNGPSWMKPRVEGPNETWNNGGDFYATRYAWNKALAYWHIVTEQHNWYGVALRNIGAEVSSLYAADTTKYSVLCGVQTTTTASDSNPRLNCQRRLSSRACTINSGNGSTCEITDAGNAYAANTPIQILSTGATANVPSPLVKNTTIYYVKTPGDTFTISTTPGGAAIVYNGAQTWAGSQYTVICDVTAPYAYATHVCPATYITPSEYRSNIEVQRAFAYQGGDLTQIDDYVDSLAVDATDGTNTGHLPAHRTNYFAWKAWGEGFSVNKMCAYEGGYSFNPLTTSGAFGTGTALPVTSVISGATLANPCVLTLATTVVQSSATRTGNPSVVGMTITPSGVSGTTQLNGNIYTVSAVNVGGDPNKVAIDVDATGFSAFNSATVTLTIASPGNVAWASHGLNANNRVVFSTTGALPTGLTVGREYFVKTVVDVNNFTVSASAGGTVIAFTGSQSGVQTCAYAPGIATYVNAGTWLYNFRLASKASTRLQGYTYGTPAVGTKSNYQNFTEAGGEFPSQYYLASSESAWAMYSPNIYSTPSPAALGIIDFNN